MSDTPSAPAPKVRTSSDVQFEYQQALFKLGAKKRTIFEQERDIKMLNESLDSLNVEYNSLLQNEQKVATAVAKAKADADAEAALSKGVAQPDNVTPIKAPEASS